MLLLRPGELRFGEWVEIDLDAALWTVPAVRMKRELREKPQGAPHLVPLPKQAVAVLRGLQPLTGGGLRPSRLKATLVTQQKWTLQPLASGMHEPWTRRTL